MPRNPLAYLTDIVEACDAIIDATVWAIADHDAPVLQRECVVLIEELHGVE